MGFHDGGIEAVGFDVAGVGDFHVAHHAQAFYVGIERADAVGQVFGQHRDDAAGEIDAGSAFAGIGIDCVIGFDVVADIGNGDDEAVVASDFFGVYGIVKIAGGFAVYRNQR